MNIAIVGSDGPDSLEGNMLEAFQSIDGVNAEIVHWPPRVSIGRLVFLSRALNRLVRKRIIRSLLAPLLIRHIQSLDSDLILVCTGAARLLPPKVIMTLKKYSKAVFCWFVDASMNMSENILRSEYDHIYFIDKGLHDYLSPILKSNGSSVLLEGFNVYHHRASENFQIGNKIAVVGSMYPERMLLLEHLVQLGFQFEIYGFGLPRGYGDGPLRKFDMKQFLTLERKSEVFQNSRCVLNNFHPAHLDAINCRVFEAMASGALVVSQSSEQLRATFVDGKDLLLYDTFDDLVDVLTKIFHEEVDEISIRKSSISAVAAHSLSVRADKFISDFEKFTCNSTLRE